MSFQRIATEIARDEYLNYAMSLTGSRDDAGDLIGDLVLSVYDKLAKFEKAEHGGYLCQMVKTSLKNRFINSKKKKNDIDVHELRESFSSNTGLIDTEPGRRALQKLQDDSNSNNYYPLLHRKVKEYGGAYNLAEVTNIPLMTIYTGLNRYKNDLKKVKKILLIVATKETGVGYHRLLKPYTMLKDLRHDIIVDRSNFYFNKDHDIIIFNRLCGVNYNDERAVINEAKVCGQKIIMDIDDYWELPPGHILEHSWKKDDMMRRITQNMREADVVTTTNEVLALKVLKYNKNVVVLPNALNETDLQWRPVPQPSHLYRFGYAGSAAHTTDVPVLRKACNKMHSKITGFQFVLIGYSPQDPATHLFEEVLTSRYTNKKDTYTRFERRPVLDYGGTYNFVDCALAPLDDCLFNRCKSNLKILEAAAHRIPIICSKIHPYYGSDFDKCVLFAESENDWYEKMIKVLHNPNYGKDMGAKAHEIFLKNYTYKQVNKLRSEII